MSGDTLTYDMSSAPEGQASIFLRKDYLSLLDSNNGSYVSNNIIFETSSIANSNRFCAWRDSYLLVPLLITMTSGAAFQPATADTSADYVVGLKNHYGTIISSYSLDYNGANIVQQTPFIALYNNFKLLTTLSYQDCISQGASIGFWPDSAESTGYTQDYSTSGSGVTNNRNGFASALVTGAFAQAGSVFNEGMQKRQSFWNFDPEAIMPGSELAYSRLMTTNSLTLVWKSYIFNKTNGANGIPGVWQANIMACIYLRHFSSFFASVPLLKGVFFRLSLFVNQPSVNFTIAEDQYSACTVNSPLGGISPLMLASMAAGNGANTLATGNYIVNLSVGQLCLNPAQSNLRGVAPGRLARNCQLIVPSYVMNPVFESAYLSSEIKKISFEGTYNFNVSNIAAGATFTNLLTNGISNQKSLLIVPFYTAADNGAAALLPIQSPFSSAGGGTTSPFAYLGNFQAQVSGANVLYNQNQYLSTFFLQQFYGTNAVNAGLTDGLTSGLISKAAWETSYTYWYLDTSRMLPCEEAIPKSVQITGQNLSTKPLDLYCFITFGQEISVSVLSGARV